MAIFGSIFGRGVALVALSRYQLAEKIELFVYIAASDSTRREDRFQKKCPKRITKD